MPHARTQIRNALTKRLSTLPAFAQRVFENRDVSLDPTKRGGPCLLITAGDEPRIEAASIGTPHIQRRTLSLVVRVIAKAADNVDDVLDQCQLDIELAIAADPTLGNVVKRGLLLESVVTGIDESLERPLGLAQLTYTAQYNVMSHKPDVLL